MSGFGQIFRAFVARHLRRAAKRRFRRGHWLMDMAERLDPLSARGAE